MVSVGDRVHLSNAKGPGREGVVTALTGSLVRIRWSSEQESTIAPAAGMLTVLGPSADFATVADSSANAQTAQRTKKEKKKSSSSKDRDAKQDAKSEKKGAKKSAKSKRKAPKKKKS